MALILEIMKLGCAEVYQMQSKEEKQEIINTAIDKSEMLWMGVNATQFIVTPLAFTDTGSLKYMFNGNIYISNIEHASFSYFEESL